MSLLTLHHRYSRYIVTHVTILGPHLLSNHDMYVVPRAVDESRVPVSRPWASSPGLEKVMLDTRKLDFFYLQSSANTLWIHCMWWNLILHAEKRPARNIFIPIRYQKCTWERYCFSNSDRYSWFRVDFHVCTQSELACALWLYES